MPRWFHIIATILILIIFAFYLKNKITSGESFTAKELLHWGLTLSVVYTVYVMFIRETPAATAPSSVLTGGSRRRRR